jgi:hypothetical protein
MLHNFKHLPGPARLLVAFVFLLLLAAGVVAIFLY